MQPSPIQFYAARNLGTVYGPFPSAEAATQFTHSYEKTRDLNYRTPSGNALAMGWYITQVKTVSEGFTEALMHKAFDRERVDHQREIDRNLEAAE